MTTVPATGRVFGIGLNKTGTTSLGQALNLLGIKTIDYPTDPRTLEQLEEGDYRLDILEEYSAVTDTPIGFFYPQLDTIYPGSKYILTIREKEKWLRSVADHWPFVMRWCKYEEQFRRFTYYAFVTVYGSFSFQEDRYSFVYDQYVSGVREFFAHRQDDLLVMNICAGDGWDTLCPFLGLPIPDVPFPRANAKEEKAKRMKWGDQLEAAISELDHVWDYSSPLMVADEHKLANSAIWSKKTVIPFPERQGVFKGRPAGSAEAIAELQRLQANGVRHIAFSWPTFWWLNHYTEFADYVRKGARQLIDSEKWKLFELRNPLPPT